MTTDRKKSGVAFWATVAVVALLVTYPPSFGPACWIGSHSASSRPAIEFAYRPVAFIWCNGSNSLKIAIRWYANLFAADGVKIGLVSKQSDFYMIVFSDVPDK
jgi:hypothetical protein